jgi:hypothetical protein
MTQLRSRLPRRIGSTGFIWRKQTAVTSTSEPVLQYSLWFINNYA